MTISCTPRNDSVITINSALGKFETDLENLVIEKKLSFILTCIKKFYTAKNGFDLIVTSDFSEQVGLGSSAAVTAATLGVLAHLESNFDPDTIFKRGFEVIRQVQGTGSGADLAASVYGGILKYRM